MRKIDSFRAMAEETTKDLLENPEKWIQFLDTASRVYKYSYADQILIFSQKPDATACATYDIWNQAMGRFVRKGRTGIGLIDQTGAYPKIQYVFDVSDTVATEKSRSPKVWKFREEHEAACDAALRGAFDTDGISFPALLSETAMHLIDDYWYDHTTEILSAVSAGKDFTLETEEQIRESFMDTAVASTEYILLSRCGLDVSELHPVDFHPSDFFGTPSALIAVGTAISDTSESVLRLIEVTVKRYDKEHKRDRNPERSRTHEQGNLHSERGLQNPGFEAGRRADNSRGQVRPAAEGVSAGASSHPVEQSVSERNPVDTSGRGGADRTAPTGENPAGAGKSSRSNGGTEGQQSHEVGGPDEHLQGQSRGADPTRADLHLEDDLPVSEEAVSQFSLFPSEGEQIRVCELYEPIEDDAEGNRFAFSCTQEEIDAVLVHGCHSSDHRMQMITEFSKGKSIPALIDSMQEVYQGGCGLMISGRRISAWFDKKDGIKMALGSASRYSPRAQIIPWDAAVQRVNHLLDTGSFATTIEIAEAPGNERKRIADRLWYLSHDISVKYRETLLTTLSDLHGGFPDETALIASNLENSNYRTELISELQALIVSYREDRDVLRFHYHDADQLLMMILELDCPRKSFNSDLMAIEEISGFITDDEIDHLLCNYGSGYSGGKTRIARTFQSNADKKEKVDFLRSEFGTGGHSPALLGAWNSDEMHDSKGMKIKKANCPAVLLTWPQMAKKLERLMQLDRYFTSKEKKILQHLDDMHTDPDQEFELVEDMEPAPTGPSEQADAVVSSEAKIQYAVGPNENSHNMLDRSAIQSYIIRENETPVPHEVIGVGLTEKCVSLTKRLNNGSLSVLDAQAELQADRSKWHCYVIPDLKTWMPAIPGEKAMPRTDIEFYDSYASALNRFRELRSMAYNDDDTTNPQNGRPYVRLAFGVQREEPAGAADLIHVCAGENYLVEDFIHSPAMLESAEVMGVLHQLYDDVGFDKIRHYEQSADGTFAEPVILPFEKWENPYFPSKDMEISAEDAPASTGETDADFASKNLIPRETTFIWDDRTFLVDRVDPQAGTVELEDRTFAQATGFPINRVAHISTVRAYLEHGQDEPAVSPILPDDYETGSQVQTPRGNFAVVSLSMEQMQQAGYGLHHHTEDEKYAIMGNGSRAFAIKIPLKEKIQPDTVQNFHITDDHLGEGGPKAKFVDNLRAIQLLKQLELEDRQAAPDEQEILSRYVGWGGLSEVFDPDKPAWNNEYQKLIETLTPAEYTSARSSTLNAHYTSPTIIRSIYEVIENMGFRTGNILEPACGVGNFLGLLPNQMQNSRLYGVELDSLSGRIAQKLYPSAQITVAGFETTDRRDFYDLAIGNVPFGQYQVNDPAYNKLHFNIHNYFFAKALDQVRSGGLIAFITSRYTMDSKDSTVRRYLAQRADLLGAVRLPNNAFKANAGAEVVSDIIFLQKREQILDITPDWTEVQKNYQGYYVNRYFLEHPEMVIGDESQHSTAHGMDYTVVPSEDYTLADLLHSAISQINGTYNEVSLTDILDTPAKNHEQTLPADPNVKDYSYTIVEGNVFYRVGSIMSRTKLPKATEARIKGMIELRDILNDLISAQLENLPDAVIQEKQEALGLSYDDFKKRHGRLNDSANEKAFSSDASYFLLAALEVTDDNGHFLRKADMFTKRTIQIHQPKTVADTAVEALEISISEKAMVDMDYMEQLTGKTESQLFHELRGIIFRDSMDSADGDYVYRAADDFLSGNIRSKLDYYSDLLSQVKGTDLAQPIADNVEALKKAMPKDLDASEIDVRLGATWIAPEYIQDFMQETFSMPWYLRRTIRVEFTPLTGQWFIENKGKCSNNDVAAYTTYGTDRANAYKILEESLNLRDIQIKDRVEGSDGIIRYVINKKETTLAQVKQQAIENAFRDWVWKDPDRRQALVGKYNKLFNSTRPREYDGSHLVFSGMNPEISLHDHQRNAIAHIIYGGNTLLAHEVGAGKTFEMIAAAMESKRLGLCQKSLFVVPKHLTLQWANEFLRLYPGANILYAREKDFEPKNRKKFCARISTGDYDAVILGQTQFEKIPVSQERQEAMLKAQLDELEQAILASKYQAGEKYSVKQMESTRKNLQNRLKKLAANEKKDNVITFEQLGVDRLFIDESQAYKNLSLYTKMRNVAGLSISEAQRSTDLFMKCRYMDEITGGRGVIFASGTPISNSPTELYTLMRYLQYGMLQDHALTHFDAWASTFGETTTSIELAPEGGGYRARTRFSKFYNLPELMTLFKDVADIKTADQLDLDVPKAKFETVVVKPSEHQKKLVASLSERASDVHNGAVDVSEDNMLVITNDGRKLGLDQRLMNPMLPDDPGSKLNACVSNVIRIWEEGKADKLTQMIFCDMSIPKTDGSFSVYNDIRDKLIAHGVPEQEIAFIHSAKNDDQKAKLFAKVRSGQVRILLGSTEKMGAGTNCQNLLIAVHHLDVPWRPSDMTQRNGRIIRQGNTNKEVQIYQYVTEGTFDAYLYQTLENKQKFISQIMTSKAPVRSYEDVDAQQLSYAEIKALCAGDPKIKEKMDLDIDVAKLKLLKANYQSKHFQLEDMLLKVFPQKQQEHRNLIESYHADLKTAAEHPQIKDGFCGMTIGTTSLTDQEAAGNALLAVCQSVQNSNELRIGSYRGFDMSLMFNDFTLEFYVHLHGKSTYTCRLGMDARGNITRLDNTIDGLIQKRLEHSHQELENLCNQQKAAEAELLIPFPQENELKAKSARLAELNIILDLNAAEPTEEAEKALDEIVASSPSQPLTMKEQMAQAIGRSTTAPDKGRESAQKAHEDLSLGK